LVMFATQLRQNQSPEQQKKANQTSLYYMPYISIPDLLAGYENYNEVVGQIAAQTGALLVGGDQLIPGDQEDFVDSIHFTDKGSQVMAKHFAGALIESPSMEKIVTQHRLTFLYFSKC